MKLSPHVFTRFWDVHAWLGVTAGIVLFAMFFAGGFTLFYDELTDWQEPAGATTMEDTAPARPLGALVAQTLREKKVAVASLTELTLALPAGGGRFVDLDWRANPGGPAGELRIDRRTGAVVPPTSHLARLLFWLHFLNHPRVPWGMYVAGLLGVALLVAIVTGVLIHVKDIVRQFHQLRPDRAARVVWSDLHKVLGVMGLPFQLMYAFTGAMLCLTPLLLGLFERPVFHGDRAAAAAAVWGPTVTSARDGQAAKGFDLGALDALVERACAVVPGFRPTYVSVDGLGDATATMSLWGARPGRLFAHGDVVLRLADGAVLAERVTSPPTPAASITRWVTGLHYVWFGGLTAKIFYVLLAAAGAVTLLSGNAIWLARRDGQALHTGNRILAKLTIGVPGGLILGTAALFWANRLAPPPLRLAAESWALFGVWGLCALLFLVRAEWRTGWIGLLSVGGAAFALVPLAAVVNGGTARLAGVDVGLSIFGLALWMGATVMKRHGAGPTRVRRQQVCEGLEAPERDG